MKTEHKTEKVFFVRKISTLLIYLAKVISFCKVIWQEESCSEIWRAESCGEGGGRELMCENVREQNI